MTPKDVLENLLEGTRLSSDLLDKFLQENPDEGQYLDYKDGAITAAKERANGRKTIREYINGFSNSDGGILIIGVGNEKPRAVKACTLPGSEPLDKWAENCVHDMAPYFSPQPRFQVVDHPTGPVLVIAVARAISLVPCVESRQMKYFFRINQTTLEAPDYLISDLVLGRRRHPFLDLRCEFNDKNELTSEFSIKAGRDADIIPTRDIHFGFVLENMGLLTAYDIEVGILTWSFTEKVKPINRYLLSYVDIVNPERAISSFQPMLYRNNRMDLVTFQQIESRFHSLCRFPLVSNGKANCAVYIVTKDASPTWFQLEYVYGSGMRGRVTLTRLGTGRPKVSWEG